MVVGPGGGAVLNGVLERVTFANPETGYTIARIAPDRGGAELVTAVGPLLGTQIGELPMRGHQTSHYARIIHIGSYQEPDARTFSGRTHGGPTGLSTRASGNLLEVSVAASGRWPDIWARHTGLKGGVTAQAAVVLARRISVR